MDSPLCATWTVIKFLSDNSVEAVPTTWLTDNNECFWPPFTVEKTASAIRSHMDVNTCWPSHKIKIFRNSTYADYSTARQKTKKAEETSDLNSDLEENFTKKRARQPRRRLSSSGDEELPQYKTPPKLKKKISVPANNNALRALHLPSTPLPNKTFKTGSQVDLTPTIKEHSHFTSPCPSISQDSEVLKEVLQQQYLIKSMLKDISSDLAKFTQERQQQAQEESESFIEKLAYFPLKNLDDLISFNSFLKDEETFKSAVNEIIRLGGKNNCDFVSRSCSMLLSDSFAKDFSWLGRREKEPFCKMNLARLIIEAAQKSNKATDKKETEINISNWLRRANVRLVKKAKTLE